MQVVVGAAIVAAGRVLAAQRSYPAPLAGQWELPGGKVEPGESDADALVRECREELGVVVLPGRRLGDEVPITGGVGVLRVYLARLTDGVPAAREHAELRWVAAEGVEALPWLESNRALLPALRRALLKCRR